MKGGEYLLKNVRTLLAIHSQYLIFSFNHSLPFLCSDLSVFVCSFSIINCFCKDFIFVCRTTTLHGDFFVTFVCSNLVSRFCIIFSLFTFWIFSLWFLLLFLYFEHWLDEKRFPIFSKQFFRQRQSMGFHLYYFHENQFCMDIFRKDSRKNCVCSLPLFSSFVFAISVFLCLKLQFTLRFFHCLIRLWWIKTGSNAEEVSLVFSSNHPSQVIL